MLPWKQRGAGVGSVPRRATRRRLGGEPSIGVGPQLRKRGRRRQHGGTRSPGGAGSKGRRHRRDSLVADARSRGWHHPGGKRGSGAEGRRASPRRVSVPHDVYGGVMSTFYTNEQRDLQEQFETVKMADLLHQVIVHSEVQEAERALIESRDMFFLATVDGHG